MHTNIYIYIYILKLCHKTTKGKNLSEHIIVTRVHVQKLNRKKAVELLRPKHVGKMKPLPENHLKESMYNSNLVSSKKSRQKLCIFLFP